MKIQGLKRPKTMLKKNKVVGLELPTFRTYNKVIVNVDQHCR